MILNCTASEKTLDAHKKLIKNADKLLNIKNPTVLDKTIEPPTGNKHDYLSNTDRLGMDMWQYETENKRSLFLALNYLKPVINGEKWKHETLKSIDATDLIPIILLIPYEYKTLEFKNVKLKF